MKQRTLRRMGTMIALGRVGVGAASLASPEPARAWAGDAVDDPGARIIVRAFAVRDAALGLGVLQAARKGRPMRTWVLLSAVADVVDAIATGTTDREKAGPMAAPTLALAASAALSGLVVGLLLDD
jgi:hypothetical protein